MAVNKPYLHKAQYYETDQMGIIHHANYIRWFEEARVDYLERNGLPYRSIEEHGIIIPVLGVTCLYKDMVHFADTVAIYTRIDDYTGTRLNLSYEVKDETGKLMTTGTSNHCFLSAETGRLVNVKKSFPSLHLLFEAVAKES